MSERTHQPTPRRRQEARRQGHVAHSQDLVAAAVWLAALAALYVTGRSLATFFVQLAGDYWGGGLAWSNADDAAQGCRAIASGLAAAVLPFFACVLAAAVLVSSGQTRGLFLPHRAGPSWERINPIRRLRFIFSLAGGARLGFGLMKLAAILAIAAGAIYSQGSEILTLAALPPGQLAVGMADILFVTGGQVGVGLLLLAGLDYGFQRWKYTRDLRMTSQELKEELRQTAGK